jgi:E3 ubiquitin-protein ligase HUWE1
MAIAPLILQPLYKGQLQRLLLNLCSHRESRKSLVQILVDMLMLDLRGSSKQSTGATEQPFRLYGCHANITYSRPQSSDGKNGLELISVL